MTIAIVGGTVVDGDDGHPDGARLGVGEQRGPVRPDDSLDVPHER